MNSKYVEVKNYNISGMCFKLSQQRQKEKESFGELHMIKSWELFKLGEEYVGTECVILLLSIL